MSVANFLLRSQFSTQNGLQDTCILRQHGIWSSTPDRYVQILHVSSNHWACLSNIFVSRQCWFIQLNVHCTCREDGTILTQVCNILQTPKPAITTNVVNVGRQEGGSDCGLFAIAMAYDLCAGVDPVTKEYVQSEMRSHLHSCFNNKLLKPFPSTVCNNEKRILFKVTIKVYCKCRRPEEGKWMVYCDKCNVWYHKGCVPVRCVTTNGMKFLGNALSAKKVHVQLYLLFNVPSSKFASFECCIPIFMKVFFTL